MQTQPCDPYGMPTVERDCSTRTPGCTTSPGRRCHKDGDSFPNPHPSCDSAVLTNDLRDERFGQVSPCVSCTRSGEQRDCLCVSPWTEVTARQGETLFQKPDLGEKLALTPSVSRAKLWAFVQSRYQSQVSKLGPEPSPLA